MAPTLGKYLHQTRNMLRSAVNDFTTVRPAGPGIVVIIPSSSDLTEDPRANDLADYHGRNCHGEMCRDFGNHPVIIGNQIR